jgi:hypothetical protein
VNREGIKMLKECSAVVMTNGQWDLELRANYGTYINLHNNFIILIENHEQQKGENTPPASRINRLKRRKGRGVTFWLVMSCRVAWALTS